MGKDITINGAKFSPVYSYSKEGCVAKVHILYLNEDCGQVSYAVMPPCGTSVFCNVLKAYQSSLGRNTAQFPIKESYCTSVGSCFVAFIKEALWKQDVTVAQRICEA